MNSFQFFSTTQITLTGVDSLPESDAEFVRDSLNVDDKLYLRNVFEDSKNPGLLAVMRQKALVGYIPMRSQKMLLEYMRNDKIGRIVVASKKIKSFTSLDIKIKVYYEDNDGKELLFRDDSMDVCILETEKWPTPGNWQDNWYYDMYSSTDLLFYGFKELYKNDKDYSSKHDKVDLAFSLFLKQFLKGEIKNKTELVGPTFVLDEDRLNPIFLARVRSFLSNFNYPDITR